MFALISTALFFGSCKDESKEKPTLTVTFKDNIDTGWYDDEITLMVEVESEAAFSIDITNNHDTQEFSETFEAGGTTKAWAYVIPNDLAEGDEVKVTVVATNTESNLSETVEKTIKISSSNPNQETIVHKGTINADEVWSANDKHIVDGTFRIENCKITIEPGTVVNFNEDASIYVAYSSNTEGAIIANGTEAAPITFTSAATIKGAGDWNGIYLYEGTLSTTNFQHCNFEYGGGYSANYGMLHAEGNTDFSVDYCSFKYSAAIGVKLEDDDTEFSSFTNNTMSDNAGHAIVLQPNGADGVGVNNTISVTGTLGILVEGGTLDKTSTWHVQTAPFIISGTMRIESPTGNTLTIEPGTTVAFTNEAQIFVAYASDAFGAIIAEGTSAKPIVFTSAASAKTAGDWNGIYLYDGTSGTTSFKYCTIEYGGGYSDNYGMIHATDNTKFTVENCTIQYSASIGIKLDNDATAFTAFNNNTMSNIAGEFIVLQANAADGVGTGNNFQSTASNKGIMIEGSTMDKATATWHKQNAPFVVKGNVRVESASGSVLTIEAGTTVSFTNESQMYFAYASSTYAKLIAQGTASEPIRFTSSAPAGSQSKGDWNGLYFYDGTSAGTILDHCIVSYSSGYSSNYGAIHLDGTGSSVTISNSTIEHSQFWAISYDGETDSPTITNMTYNDNAGGDVNIR